MATIKQIADSLGVSKQAVRDKIKKLGLQSTLQTIGNKLDVPFATCEQVKQSFKVKSTVQYDSPSIANLLAIIEAQQKTIQTLSEALKAREGAALYEAAQPKALEDRSSRWKRLKKAWQGGENE